MCISLIAMKKWSRGNWVDRWLPWAWLLIFFSASYIAIITNHWFLYVIGYIVAFDVAVWAGQRRRWTDKRMKLRPHIPEARRFESLAKPRCELLLESSGEDSRRTARELQRIYIIAPQEARELCDNAPASLKTNVWYAEAELVRSRLEEAGAVVRIFENEQV